MGRPALCSPGVAFLLQPQEHSSDKDDEKEAAD